MKTWRKNEIGDRKGKSNDSPEISDRGEASGILSALTKRVYQTRWWEVEALILVKCGNAVLISNMLCRFLGCLLLFCFVLFFLQEICLWWRALWPNCFIQQAYMGTSHSWRAEKVERWFGINEVEWTRKVEIKTGWNCWQCTKHIRVFFDLLQTIKWEIFGSSGF